MYLVYKHYLVLCLWLCKELYIWKYSVSKAILLTNCAISQTREL